MQVLAKLELHGFRSIRHLDGLTFGPMNVLIGANGAGKSNLISFFKLLNWAMPAPGNLQLHLGRIGGANSVLYDGVGVTQQIQATLTFTTDQGTNQYHMR